jgi:hypothetical protein
MKLERARTEDTEDTEEDTEGRGEIFRYDPRVGLRSRTSSVEGVGKVLDHTAG